MELTPPIIPREYFSKLTFQHFKYAEKESLLRTLQFIVYMCCVYGNIDKTTSSRLHDLSKSLSLSNIKRLIYRHCQNVNRTVRAITATLLYGFLVFDINVKYDSELFFFSDLFVNTYVHSSITNKLSTEKDAFVLSTDLSKGLFLPSNAYLHKGWNTSQLRFVVAKDVLSSRRYFHSLLWSSSNVMNDDSDRGVFWCLPVCANVKHFNYEIAGRILSFLTGNTVDVIDAYYQLRLKPISVVDKKNKRFQSSPQRTQLIQRLTGRNSLSSNSECCAPTVFEKLCEEKISFFQNCELFLWRRAFNFTGECSLALNDTSPENLIHALRECRQDVSSFQTFEEFLYFLHGFHTYKEERIFSKVEVNGNKRSWQMKQTNKDIYPRWSYHFKKEQVDYNLKISCDECFSVIKMLKRVHVFFVFPSVEWKFFFRIMAGKRETYPVKQPVTKTIQDNFALNCCTENNIQAFLNATTLDKTLEFLNRPNFYNILKRATDGDKNDSRSYESVLVCKHSVRCALICSNKVAEIKTTNDSYSHRSNQLKPFIQFSVKFLKPKSIVTNFIRKNPKAKNVVYNVNYNGNKLDALLILRQLSDYKEIETFSSNADLHLCHVNSTIYLQGIENSDFVYDRLKQKYGQLSKMIRFSGTEIVYKLGSEAFSLFCFQGLSLTVPTAKPHSLIKLTEKFIHDIVKNHGAVFNFDKNFIFCNKEMKNRTFLPKPAQIVLESIYETGRLFLPASEIRHLIILLSTLPFKVYSRPLSCVSPIQIKGDFTLNLYRGSPTVTLHKDWTTKSLVSSWDKWIRLFL